MSLPRLVAIFGLMGSGKSHVAQAVARNLGVVPIEADRLRRQQAETGVRDALAPGFSEKLYPEMLRLADVALRGGNDVVLDATFRSRALREELRNFARERGIPLLFVECRPPRAVCRQRMLEREKAGQPGWREMFEYFLTLWEAPAELPRELHWAVDTSAALAQTLATIDAELSEHLARAAAHTLRHSSSAQEPS